MSPDLLRRLQRLQRDSTRERAWLHYYYRRELKMGARRARYYADRNAFYSPLELAGQGYAVPV